MYEVLEGTRILHGETLTTFTRQIFSSNVLEVEAGTNGYKGGDTCHGSRTYIRIQDKSGTDIHAAALGDFEDEGVEICLGGDCELETIIRALKFITKVLEEQSEGEDD